MTSHANLGFHAAWDFGADGRAVTNPEATQMLYSMYPSAVKRWIAQRGGLTPHMIFLRGKQLTSMYKPCYLDAQASSRPLRPFSHQHDVIGGAAAALARQRDWPYLNTLRLGSGGNRPLGPAVRMVAWFSPYPRSRKCRAAAKVAPAIVVAAAGLGAALLSGALVLWFHYGTAVFFEMIASGISACF